MKDIREWWQGISPRERRMVAGAGVALLLTVIWLAVVEPLQQRRAMLERGVPVQRELLTWMQDAAPRLRDAGPARAAAGQSLFAVVDRSVRATPLGGAVQRLQPEGQASVRVWLENAAFDDLVRWLGTLEREHGVSPSAIAVERTDSAGLVNARVTLDRPGQ